MPSSLRRTVVWVFICIFFQAIIEVLSILSISFLALSIASPDRIIQLPIGQIAFKLIPQLKLLQADPRYLTLACATAVAFLMLMKNLLFARVTLMGARLGERIALYTGDILFHQYLYSTYSDHLVGDSANMYQRLGWRRALAEMATALMNVFTYMAITAALSVTVIVSTPRIILVIITFFGLLSWAIYKTLRSRVEKAGLQAAEWSRTETRVTLNSMRGFRETVIYQQQPVFFDKFHDACENGMPCRAFLIIAPPIPTWILETAGFFVILACVFVMIVVNDSSMTRITAVVTIIMLAAWRILPLLNRSLTMLVSIQGTRYSAVECLTSVEQALENPAPPLVEPDPDFQFTGQIELRDVDFSYTKPAKETSDPADSDTPPPPPSLSGLSLIVPKGARVGIVGRSGAGKSTLSLLLSGLTRPDSGEMLVDGCQLDEPALAAYRAMVGFVPQNPYIMGGSIAENVAFSQWGRPWDSDKVLEACRMAEFDVAFERGIDFMLGEDGAGLSGGQAQRLAIARALYASPAILIFDEATSALDTGVEKAIMETIIGLPVEITTITIAHRLDTVRNCDIIYWIEAGTVVESGPPEVVLPHYEKFLNSQPSRTSCSHSGSD